MRVKRLTAMEPLEETSSMLADTNVIETCIPHRTPMRLVDRLLASQGDQATVESQVRPHWPGAADGLADPVLLIEVVAQSVAVLVGWQRRHEEKMGGRGLLVGVRKTEIQCDELRVGDRLQSHVELLYKVENYAVYQGRVLDLKGRLLAQVELQSYRPDDFPGAIEEKHE